ncbi:hypothetical protein IJG79_00840 [Candidatus Saccharibacteria bacterium]|nr:hypothetical protein [Candidatus Saccharibacteria bacterium]
MKSRVKSIQDPRYINIQKRFNKIIEGFICRGQIMKLQVKIITTRANVSPSTFYDHYKDMDEAIFYANHRMEKELTCLKEEIISGNQCDLEIVYMKILFFIYKNRDYYEMATTCKNTLPLSQIMDTFQSIVCDKWRCLDREKLDWIFQIYVSEFTGIIIYWGQEEQFKKTKIHHYAKALARLNKTAYNRLR